MQQKIIVTALPNGLTGSQRGSLNIKKVSAAISLQVTGTSNNTLATVKDMLNWADLISKATFTVMINDNIVEAKVVSKPVDVQLWKNLFAPTVKVNAFEQEDLSKIPLLSYPVKHILNYIKGVTQKTGTQYSDKMPDSNFFTSNAEFTGISMYSVDDFKPGNGREKPSLKELVHDNNAGINRVSSAIKNNKFFAFNPSPQPSFDFAQLRNFHGLYNKKPKLKYTPPPKPDFEFHDIVSVLSSYPQLMRRLGLVIDIEITDKPATSGTIRLSATSGNIRIIPKGLQLSAPTTIVCPATAFNITDKGFYAKGDTGSAIEKGHLKINTDDFTVFQLDADGAALKIGQQIDGLQLKKAKQNFHAQEGLMVAAAQLPIYNNELPRKEGLPAQRTAGIAIARNGMAEQLNKKFNRMNELKGKLTSALLPVPASISSPNATYQLSTSLLFADDINLGYRMDVYDTAKAKWHSLHFRQNEYSFTPKNTNNKTVINNLDADEGFIQIAASQGGEGADLHLKVGEAIARWEGWSLSVPKPGISLNDPLMDKKQIPDQNGENAKYKKPGNADFALEVKPGIKPGTLPQLRFGRQYQLKLRTVDMAGNSVAYDAVPENENVAVVKNIIYKRYEPTGAPALVMGNTVKDGESIEQVVIRSNEKLTPKEYEAANGNKFVPDAIRHVKPPRCTVQMAEQHRMLDQAFGTSPAIAESVYNKIITKDPEFDANKATSTMEVFTGKDVTIEYLADPMAAGVTFFISDLDPNTKAPNADEYMQRVSFYFDEAVKDNNQNNVIDFNAWMQPKPFKIKLEELTAAKSKFIEWVASERTLYVRLGKGYMLKLNYASFWRPIELQGNSGILDMLGITNFNTDLGKKILSGRHWMFSPWRELTFVHAVQQPVQEPTIAGMKSNRNYGDTTVNLAAKLKVHSVSTDKLDIEAKWKEMIDDLDDDDGPKEINGISKVFHFTTLYNVGDYQFGDVEVKNNPFIAIPQQFSDTKHRMVDYKTIATSRYREYFTALHKANPNFLLTKESKGYTLNILSSARPAAPEVAYVIPSFEWERNTNGNLTLTGRVTALRVYLKRPWFSSGDGEKLAVVLSDRPTTEQMNSHHYTTWGTDPVRMSAPVPGAGPKLDLFVGRNATDKNISMAEGGKADVAAYDVTYDKERHMYYADVMVNFGLAYTPFIRLALARYQKDSLRTNGTDCCLSPVVFTDYIQMPSLRATSLKIDNGKNNITVAISGTISDIGKVEYGNRFDIFIDDIDVPAADDTYINVITTEKETHIAEATYMLNSMDIKNNAFYYSKAFALPAAYANKAYRIRIFEYEVLNADPLRHPPINMTIMLSPAKQERLVFADVYEVK